MCQALAHGAPRAPPGQPRGWAVLSARLGPEYQTGMSEGRPEPWRIAAIMPSSTSTRPRRRPTVRSDDPPRQLVLWAKKPRSAEGAGGPFSSPPGSSMRRPRAARPGPEVEGTGRTSATSGPSGAHHCAQKVGLDDALPCAVLPCRRGALLRSRDGPSPSPLTSGDRQADPRRPVRRGHRHHATGDQAGQHGQSDGQGVGSRVQPLGDVDRVWGRSLCEQLPDERGFRRREPQQEAILGAHDDLADGSEPESRAGGHAGCTRGIQVRL